MLSTRDALISALILTLYYVGVIVADDRRDFVTMGLRNSRRGSSRRTSHRFGGMAMDGVGFHYTLRYQPGVQLQKFAQQEEPPMSPMPPEMTEMPAMPTEPAMSTEPTPTEPEGPEPTIPMRTTSEVPPSESPTPPPSTDMMMTMPGGTDMMPTAMPTQRPTMRPTVPVVPTPSTTRSSIMQPTTFPGKLALKLKQLIFGSPVEANLILKQPSAGKSKGKGFLSLFEVIKFPNTKCSVSMGDIRTMEGVCYHEFECKSLGGIPTESCADGVGACCICEYRRSRILSIVLK